MKKIFVDDVHEYDYVMEEMEDGEIHSLYRSNSKSCSDHVIGEIAVSIFNSGNGFEINVPKKIKKLDYSDAFALSILLKMLSFNDHKVTISQEPVLL